MTTRLTTSTRRDLVHSGIRMGYSVRQIARYLGVSTSVVYRDRAAMPALREESASWPDACRNRPSGELAT